ncbi:hypothetical protein BH10PSE4_BH10PSE4_34120 [soil metagenome]
MDDDEFLRTISLDANEWRGVNQLENAMSDFEPLAKRGNLGITVTERLVRMGLAERGRPSDAYAGRGYEVGYRLSELGWKVAERGRWVRRAHT